MKICPVGAPLTRAERRTDTTTIIDAVSSYAKAHNKLAHFPLQINVIVKFFSFLGAFEKLLRATIIFVKSVCPSVRLFSWNNSASTLRIFMKSDVRIVRKSVKKIEISLKSDKNNGYFT